MTGKYASLLLLALFLTSGCSSGGDTATTEQTSKDHILTEQVHALEKAKETGQLMQRMTDKQRQTLDEESK